MVKREWYLIWYNIRHQSVMSTRLKKIHAVTQEPIEPAEVEMVRKKIEETLDNRRTEAVIEITLTTTKNCPASFMLSLALRKK